MKPFGRIPILAIFTIFNEATAFGACILEFQCAHLEFRGGGVIGENYECLGAIHPSVVFGGDVLRE
jgi:hypothetical protein